MTTTTYTHSTYTVVARPKGAEFQEFNCHFCAYHSLTKPVFLKSAEGTIVAAGAGCAALIMYGYKSESRKVTRAFDLANFIENQNEEVRAELRVAATEALEAFNAGIGYTPNLQRMRVNYNKNGIAPTMNFHEYLAFVATTGELN